MIPSEIPLDVFVNLQNETLIDIDFSKWTGIEKIATNCIDYTYNVQRRDTVDEISLSSIIGKTKVHFMANKN